MNCRFRDGPDGTAVAITTIILMVLISIQPFHLGKLFLFTATVLLLSSAFCLGDPLFMSVGATMSDHKTSRSQRALESRFRENCDRQTDTATDPEVQYMAIPSLAPRLTAYVKIGTWPGLIEMNRGYSWIGAISLVNTRQGFARTATVSPRQNLTEWEELSE